MNMSNIKYLMKLSDELYNDTLWYIRDLHANIDSNNQYSYYDYVYAFLSDVELYHNISSN
jgi:DNA replication initiation complex subunit (GINS family)